MKTILVLAGLCALLIPGALRAESFEGAVSMKITSAKGGAQAINLVLKEGFVRADVTTPQGPTSLITDYARRQMTILMPSRRMYMVQPLPDTTPQAGSPGPAAGPSAEQPGFQVTTDGETILGYPCTKYVVTGKDGSTTEVWATQKLGAFFGLGPAAGGRPGGRPQPPQAWERMLVDKGFFPLRAVTSQGGKETFRLEVTSVEKTGEPDSAFAPPEGWSKFDMGALMRGAMSGSQTPPGSN